MSNIDKRALRKAAEKHGDDDILALLDELEAKDVELQEYRKAEAENLAVRELLKRAKALMYQSGGSPIESSLNPIDAFLYDAERAAAGKGEAS